MGKGMKHYTEDGEYNGPTHKMDGEVHTGAKHSETSKVISHNKKGPFEMKGYTYPGTSPIEKNKGLWHNIRAKRARGEAPAKVGSKAHNSAVAAAKEINKNS
tara:strand:- start:749 stop:1054 length:306 start_codon:yes stop_codon:yes gene_type:complete